MACGRRWGKTETGKIAVIEAAATGGIAWWIMPSYRMADDVWRSLKTTLEGAWREKNEQQHVIVLQGGGVIRVRSGDDPDSLRGASLDLAVLDEAAFLHEIVWTAALRPALSDRRGRAMFLSTPKGVGNWFYRIYGYGLDPNRPDWQSWQFPTSANPRIAAEEIEEARRDLPERVFRAEYLAEFLTDGGSVFRNVLANATAIAPSGPEAGHRYVFGIDWGRVDFSCAVALDATTRKMVAIDRFNGIGWALQRGRLAALASVWRPASIWAEENSIGGPNVEALQAEGLPIYGFTTTVSSKDDLITALALALEQGKLAILPDPILLHELQAYTMTRLPSGRFRYSAPGGGHDDTVIALALAWQAAQYGGGSLTFG
ncbi:MAG: terminase large subunit domain-containing protein [Aggregatilineales bacterium]